MVKVIKVDPLNVGKTIQLLEAYKKDFLKKTSVFAEKVAEWLKDRVQANFDSSISDRSFSTGDIRNADVQVSVTKEGNTLLVVATGDETYFCEFGTGIFYNGAAGSSPHPEGARLGMRIGMYGKGLGSRHMWAYKDMSGRTILTRGVQAQMPMYRAFMELMDPAVIGKLARSVYG